MTKPVVVREVMGYYWAVRNFDYDQYRKAWGRLPCTDAK